MNNIKGSVSLFSALIFLLVAAVISVTIKSARIHGASVIVNTSLNMGLDSLFSSYDSELFNQFGVLLLDGSENGNSINKDALIGKLTEYMSYNLESDKGLYFSNSTDLYGIKTQGTAIDRTIKATDEGGLLWMDMVVDYEKYAKPISLAAEYLGLETTVKESKIASEITEDIIAVTESVVEINEQAQKLVEYIDGVKCSNQAVAASDNYPEFAKVISTKEVSKNILAINNQDAYDLVSPVILNPTELLDSAVQYAMDGDFDSAKVQVEMAVSYTDSALSGIMLAHEILESFDELENKIISQPDSLKENIENIDGLSEIVSDGLKEEIEGIENYKDNMTVDICDIEKLKTQFYLNWEHINKIGFLASEIDYESSSGKIVNKINQIQAEFDAISYDGMEFNYESIKQTEEKSDLLTSLSEFWNSGILALVTPTGTVISDSSINYSQLASSVCNTDNIDDIQENCKTQTLLAKKIIYTEYVMDNFNSFIDKKDDNKLSYEVEYIINGKKSDKDNLKETVDTIALMRSGVNMAYLMTDMGKQDEAYALALSIMGWTGIDPIVRLTQFGLMYLWAYAEGLADVRTLLNGGKIPLVKTADTWQLSLSGLIACQLEENEKEQTGLDYEMFLRLLLYLESDGEKSAYTMDLVEVWMINSGRKNFRLKNYIYGIEASTIYSVQDIDAVYTQSAVYTY